jgi:hypothetical protein
MFEGKEVQGQVGDLSYEVDVTEKGTVKAAVEFDVIAFLQHQAEKTQTPWDDAAVSWIKKVLGQ